MDKINNTLPKKDLLIYEKDYSDTIHSTNETDKEFKIRTIFCQEKGKKPNIHQMSSYSSVLHQVKQFLPKFVQDTNNLLNDPIKMAESKCEIIKDNIKPKSDIILQMSPQLRQIMKKKAQKNKIKMDLYMTLLPQEEDQQQQFQTLNQDANQEQSKKLVQEIE